MERDLQPALITEGACPQGHGLLERRDGYGWCAECGAGWSIDPGAVSIHLLPRVEVLESALRKITESVHRDGIAYQRRLADGYGGVVLDDEDPRG